MQSNRSNTKTIETVGRAAMATRGPAGVEHGVDDLACQRRREAGLQLEQVARLPADLDLAEHGVAAIGALAVMQAYDARLRGAYPDLGRLRDDLHGGGNDQARFI